MAKLAARDLGCVREYVSFPLYTCEWADWRTVLAGGGGGPSKTGVKNGAVAFEFDHAAVEACSVGALDTDDATVWSMHRVESADASRSSVLLGQPKSFQKLELVKHKFAEPMPIACPVLRAQSLDHQMVSCIEPDLCLLVTAAENGDLAVQQYELGKAGRMAVKDVALLKQAHAPLEQGTAIWAVAAKRMSSRRALIATCGYGRMCSLWQLDVTERKITHIRTLQPHSARHTTRGCGFVSTAHGTYLVTAEASPKDGTRLCIRDVLPLLDDPHPRSAEKLEWATPHLKWFQLPNALTCLKISADERFVACGFGDGRVIAFRIHGQELRRATSLRLFTAAVTGIAFAPLPSQDLVEQALSTARVDGTVADAKSKRAARSMPDAERAQVRRASEQLTFVAVSFDHSLVVCSPCLRDETYHRRILALLVFAAVVFLIVLLVRAFMR